MLLFRPKLLRNRIAKGNFWIGQPIIKYVIQDAIEVSDCDYTRSSNRGSRRKFSHVSLASLVFINFTLLKFPLFFFDMLLLENNPSCNH